MIHKLSLRSGAFALAAFLLASPVSAADIPKIADSVKWDTARITSPESVAELKALQVLVKEVNKQSLPTTVGLLVGNGAGSGVIVSDDGLVLTAAHVVGKPRQSIIFVLSDGTFVKGESLGINTAADSGMARITEAPPKNATWPGAKEGKWPVAEMGKSAELKLKQWVVAMGHPGGPKQDRPPPVRTGRMGSPTSNTSKSPLLQTDCILVGGDSGGPLFDLAGKVIGIHSQINPFFLEANMHVPVDRFRTEWDRLVRGDSIGRVSGAILGVKFDDAARGATIAEVVEDSAAAKADLAAGDVILKLHGTPVTTPSDVTEMLSSYDPDDKVKFLIRRGDETLGIEVKLGGVKNASTRPRRNQNN